MWVSKLILVFARFIYPGFANSKPYSAVAYSQKRTLGCLKGAKGKQVGLPSLRPGHRSQATVCLERT